MAITFKTAIAAKPSGKAKAKRVYRNTQPEAPIISLSEPGRIRNKHFQALLGGLSQAGFWKQRKRGLVPPHDGNDGHPYWNTETVRTFLTASGAMK